MFHLTRDSVLDIAVYVSNEYNCHSRFRSFASTFSAHNWRWNDVFASSLAIPFVFMLFSTSSFFFGKRYLRARLRDHYSPIAGMHTQFCQDLECSVPDQTSFVEFIRTQDTYTHKILNIISHNNFFLIFQCWNFRILSRSWPYHRRAHCCVCFVAMVGFFFSHSIFPFELLHLVLAVVSSFHRIDVISVHNLLNACRRGWTQM